MSKNTFSELGISQWLNQFLKKINYLNPTQIQKQSISKIIQNKDTKNCIVIQSETGSGKTGCFGLPIIDKLSKEPYGIYCLVITSSRELSVQISEQLQVYGQSFNIRVSNMIGGMDIIQQSIELDSIPHIVVGTPGRLSQLIEINHTFQQYIQNLQYLVLDEVDTLINTNIHTHLQPILNYIPNTAFKVFASATFSNNLSTQFKQQLNIQQITIISLNPQSINQINLSNNQIKSQLHQQNDKKDDDDNNNNNNNKDKNCNDDDANINNKIEINKSIEQKYVFIPSQVSEYYLIHLIKKYEGVQMIVFVNKCRDAHLYHLICSKMNLECTVLHSLLSQKQRLTNIKLFRNKNKLILFTTDISSRGLDIPNVDLVINKDLPRSFKDYLHRIGRTARNNNRGTSISLVTQYDLLILQNIQDKTNQAVLEIKIDEKQVMDKAVDIIKCKKSIEVFMSEKGITNSFLNKKVIKL